MIGRSVPTRRRGGTHPLTLIILIRRCHRLGKDCQPSTPIRKRVAKKQTLSRTAQLEQKLDSLVTLIKKQGVSPTTTAAAAALLQDEVIPDADDDEADENGDHHHHPEGGTPPISPTASGHDTASSSYPGAAAEGPPSRQTQLPSSPYADIPISEEDAQENLDQFRTKKLKYFHLVDIPPDMTAAQLREQKPLLWLSIMSVSDKSTRRQVAFGVHFKVVLAKKLFEENDRSPDMLQACITYLGWAMYHVFGKPFLCLFLSTTMGIMQDLGINKPVITEPTWHSTHPFKPSNVLKLWYYPRVRTMEDRRTFLAAYYVSSVIFQFIGKPEPMRWTPYLEECLRMIAEDPPHPDDENLVALVRYQKIANEALLTPWRTGETEIGCDSARAPVLFYIKALRAKLEHVKELVPERLKDDSMSIPIATTAVAMTNGVM